jgi:hypothetical protein
VDNSEEADTKEEMCFDTDSEKLVRRQPRK